MTLSAPWRVLNVSEEKCLLNGIRMCIYVEEHCQNEIPLSVTIHNYKNITYFIVSGSRIKNNKFRGAK